MKKTEKLMWVCDDCGSIHLQQKAWVKLNDGGVEDYLNDKGDFWCEDCEAHPSGVDTRVIKCVNGAVKVQGYQVEAEIMGETVMHPDMEGSFCLYSLDQANEMINDSTDDVDWQLKAYYKGDIEDPTLMFNGKNPRK